jgi:tyrosine aminotransferase
VLVSIYGSLAEVQAGTHRLAQVILGASHLTQSAIPALLDGCNPTLALWKENLRKTLANQAELLCRRLNECHGLEVALPQGAMYAMVRISTELLDVANDEEFSQMLLQEENVFVLPGSAFGMSHVFRVVYCLPPSVLEESTRRIAAFCRRHSKKHW